MIQNIDDMTSAYEAAQNAAGTASEANEKFLDSIEGRIGQLQASTQVLAHDLISSDLFKGVVTGAQSLVDILDLLINKFGILGTAVVPAAGVAIYKNLD